MKTLFRNRLFFIPFATFLVFPFSRFFAAAPDAAVFEPIGTSIAKKIAEMQATQADKNALTTATPPPNPDPDDEPNIDPIELKNTFIEWANIQHEFPKSESMVSAEAIKELKQWLGSDFKSGYPFVQNLARNISANLADAPMYMSEVTAVFRSCINAAVAAAKLNPKRFYKADKGSKQYKATDRVGILSELNSLKLKEKLEKLADEATKEPAKKKSIISVENFCAQLSLVLSQIEAPLDSFKQDPTLIDVSTIAVQWENLLQDDADKLLQPLQQILNRTDAQTYSRQKMAEEIKKVITYEYTLADLRKLYPRCTNPDIVTTWANEKRGTAIGHAVGATEAGK